MTATIVVEDTAGYRVVRAEFGETDLIAPPRSLLMFLHGSQGDERQALTYGLLADSRQTHLVVAPRGPIDEAGSASWLTNGSPEEMRENFLDRVYALRRTVEDLCITHSLDPTQSVVVGFSQGAALAFGYACVVGSAPPPLGVGFLSGAFPGDWVDDDDLDYEAARNTQFLLQRGTLDQVIPDMADSDFVETELKKHGCQRVKHDRFELDHRVTIGTLDSLSNWLDLLSEDELL